VTAGEHPELFWALRGGGGGLGVITHFELRLHPLSQVAGLVVFPGPVRDGAVSFRDFVRDAPDEFCGMTVMTSAPPLPFLDPAWHGRTVCIVAICWSGSTLAGERVLEPIRSAGDALADVVGPMPYAQWQQMLEPSAPPGRSNYWKTQLREVERRHDRFAQCCRRSATDTVYGATRPAHGRRGGSRAVLRLCLRPS
jgi:FAD/FMN-containing dehydrogenase